MNSEAASGDDVKGDNANSVETGTDAKLTTSSIGSRSDSPIHAPPADHSPEESTVSGWVLAARISGVVAPLVGLIVLLVHVLGTSNSPPQRPAAAGAPSFSGSSDCVVPNGPSQAPASIVSIHIHARNGTVQVSWRFNEPVTGELAPTTTYGVLTGPTPHSGLQLLIAHPSTDRWAASAYHPDGYSHVEPAPPLVEGDQIVATYASTSLVGLKTPFAWTAAALTVPSGNASTSQVQILCGGVLK